MIITKLIGGLGNQMFQYAVARCLAYRQNELLKLDISGFNEYQLREYYLNQFNIIEQVATDDEIKQIKNIRCIKEEYYHFNPAILELKGPFYLEGYWQCENYFKASAPIIRQDFTFKQPLDGVNLALAERINRSEAVAVHFRRGDYATSSVTNYYHGVCPMDYYRQATQELARQVSNPHLYIFSDDPDWVGEQVRLEYPCTVIAHNRADNSHEDLRLMSFCKYHIIANSTFSWWGAWLAQYPAKIVYAPRKWFNNSAHDTRDLIPETWKLI